MSVQVENGKAYNVHHSRKGKFVLMVSSQCEEWISGTIVSGTARAMMDYNINFDVVIEAGEEITVRKSFLYSATEVPPC